MILQKVEGSLSNGKQKFVYTGIDVLESMTEAINYNNFLVSLVLNQSKDLKAKKVLDFGAGSGTYADLFKEKGIKVDCLEPDEGLRSKLKKNYKVYSSSKDLKPNTYDVIFAFNVFEHIENDSKEIAILKKALKKNGIIVIYVPAYKILFSKMDKLVGHFRRYRLKLLKELADTEELEIKKLEYYDPLGFIALLAYKVFGGNGSFNSKSVRLYDRYAFPISKTLHPFSKRVIGKNLVLVAQKQA